MPPDLQTYLLGGAVLLIVVGQVLSALKDRGIDLAKVAAQIDELYKWHDIVDSEGVKLWYVRPSLEEAISKLSINIAKQTVVLERMEVRMESFAPKKSS